MTGNIGKIFSIGPEQVQTGTFESDVFDAGAFSYWGRVTTSPRENNAVTFETRSGNLNRAQKNWSEFARTNNGRIVSPPARFLQYKLTMSGPGELTEVDVAYQMKNVAPEIEEVEITPANYKFPAPSSGALTLTPSLTLPALGHPTASSLSTPAPAADSGSSPAMSYAKGQIGARWLASDDNGDSMLFKVEIRGANEIVLEAAPGQNPRALLQLGFDRLSRRQIFRPHHRDRCAVEPSRPGPDRVRRERAVSDRQHTTRDHGPERNAIRL